MNFLYIGPKLVVKWTSSKKTNVNSSMGGNMKGTLQIPEDDVKGVLQLGGCFLLNVLFSEIDVKDRT